MSSRKGLKRPASPRQEPMMVDASTEAVIRRVRALFGEIEDTIARVQDPAARVQVLSFEWRMLQNQSQDPSYKTESGFEVVVEPHALRMLRMRRWAIQELLSRDTSYGEISRLTGEPKGTVQSTMTRQRGRRK